MTKWTCTALVVLLLLSLFLPFARPAHAGLIVRIPSNLGISSGLVGYWTMDEKDISGTAMRDRSGNGNTGTLTNGPTKTIGKLGQALKFDGSDDFVQKTLPSGMVAMDQAITISMWAKNNLAAVTPKDVMFDLDNGANNITPRVQSYGANSIFRVAKYGDTTLVATATTNAFPANTWIHYVYTFDGTTHRIYRNGVFDNSDTVAPNTATPNVITIGSLNTGFSPWAGLIDDVRIYNRALSANEIKRLYNMGAENKIKTPVTSLTTGLVGYWTMDEKDISGTAMRDRSGNNNTGTLTNGPTKAIGKLGQGLSFDGVDDYVIKTSPSNVPLGTSPRTMSAWIKRFTTPTVLRNIVGYAIPTAETGQMFSMAVGVGANKLFFWSHTNNVQGNLTIDPNNWTMVTVTYDGTTVSLYVNGVFDTSGTPTLNTIAGNLYIAHFIVGYQYFNGLIDDVRIYSRALSANEIKRLYNMGAEALKVKTPTTSLTNGLVGYWTMDEKDISGTAMRDRSGNGNTGTLTNGPTKAIGKLGQALSFDAVDDYINLSSPGSINVSEMTVQFWTKTPPNLIFWRDWFGFQMISEENGFVFEIDDVGRLNYFDIGSFSSGASLLYNVDIRDNIWKHVIFTFSQSQNISKLYVNGIIYAESIWTPNYYTPLGVQIGSATWRSGRFIKSSIDDVRIYNRALSASEIKRLYNMGR